MPRVLSFKFLLNDVEVPSFACSFSQVKSESAIVSISTRIIDGFKMSGEGKLYVVYEDNTEVLIGKGKVSGFPVGLDGDELTVDFICRAENHDDVVDALYATQDSKIDKEVVALGGKRRGEGYLPYYVYTNPTTHAVSFQLLTGTGVYHTMSGEGAAPGNSLVFSITASMRDEPIKEMIIESVAEWQQVAAKVIDYGLAAVGSISTATPDDYVNSVDNIVMNGGGGYLFTGSNVKPAFNSVTTYPVAVRKSYADVRTSILHPILYENINVYNYKTPDINVLTTLTQTRKERCRLHFVMNHGTFGGRTVTEEYYLNEPENLSKVNAPYAVKGKSNARVELYRDSIHYNTGSGSVRTLYFPPSLIMRAYTSIIDASFCTTLRIDTTADQALKVSVGDILTLNDVRLPGGKAMGRVSLVSAVIDENATGVIEIECSTCSAKNNYTYAVPLVTSLSVKSGATIPTTNHLENLYQGNANYFLEGGVEHTEGKWEPYSDPLVPSQKPIVEQINTSNATGTPPQINVGTTPIPEVYDVRGRVTEFLPATTIAIQFRDVGEVEDFAEHVMELNPFTIRTLGGLTDG